MIKRRKRKWAIKKEVFLKWPLNVCWSPWIGCQLLIVRFYRPSLVSTLRCRISKKEKEKVAEKAWWKRNLFARFQIDCVVIRQSGVFFLFLLLPVILAFTVCYFPFFRRRLSYNESKNNHGPTNWPNLINFPIHLKPSRINGNAKDIVEELINIHLFLNFAHAMNFERTQKSISS